MATKKKTEATDEIGDDAPDIEDIDEADLDPDEEDLEVEDLDIDVIVEEDIELDGDDDDDVDFDDDDEDKDDQDEETTEALEELESQELQTLDEEKNDNLLIDEVEELRAIRREELTMNVDTQLQRADEFVCQSCFMVKRMSQLANKRKQLCADCAE
ncbi:MAG TPA: DUF4193 family protein [Acidimicrobiia bacterium]